MTKSANKHINFVSETPYNAYINYMKIKSVL